MVVKKNNEEWVSDNEKEDVSQPKIKKKIVRPSIAKIEFVKSKQLQKKACKTVKQVEQHRQNPYNPRDNQRNWNNMKQVNAAQSKPTMNAAGSMSHLYKTTHSTVKRPIHKNTTFKNNNGNLQMDLHDQGVIDSGCSMHMTRNMFYLTYYEEIDGGYVAFRGNPKEGKSQENVPLKLADEGFFIGYSLNSKAFRVFNSRTWIVEENLHIRFSENTPNVVGSGPDWLFNIDALTRIMNYEAIITGTQSNGFADSKSSHNVNNTNNINTISLNVNVVDTNEDNELSFDTNIPSLEDVSIFNYLIDDEDDGTMADMNKFGYNNPSQFCSNYKNS
nr:ribonuclease H-like domain-containing protein [Tanacetum cinerariifolium]